jgi:plasmid stabilization system protein ParE
MSHAIRILPAVQTDMEDALCFTLRRFGERKYQEYRDLIHRAIEEIAANPDHPRARRRPELHRSARTFHIARPGKAARHFYLYRIAGDGVVEFARFLYDGMDLAQHLPPEYSTDAD